MSKIPDRIGKYDVIRRLGHGGMGTVYLARDPGLNRQLAIKVLRDQLFEEELIERFQREARAAGNLRHENIITVYDIGEHDHQPFMAMEYVDGISLAEMIRARQPLAVADKLSYLEQICFGLHHAHSQGIVHRDIKPANLMVDRHNVVRILDFGIARIEGSGMTRDGALIGTINYMSPEQMLGRPVDHRSDIFAFGAVAYELLAYEKAFPGTIQDGLLQRLPNEPPKPLSELCPGLPADLEPVILRALAKLPQDRFADLGEARVALRRIRRQIDPQLEIESLSGTKRGTTGASPTPTPGPPSAAKVEFLERRARQLAHHRDAARDALRAQDLDGAVAACDDALMLDPDDHEALQLRAEIDRARERRGVESKERHERERSVRRHLADADLKLSKGDVATASDLVRQALTLDPQSEAALALRSRIEEPGAANVVVPTVLVPSSRQRPGSSADGRATRGGRAGTVAPPEAPVERAEVTPPEPATSSSPRRGMLVAAVAAVAILAAGILWITSRDDASPPAPVTTARADDPQGRPADTPGTVETGTNATPGAIQTRPAVEATPPPGRNTPPTSAATPATTPRAQTPDAPVDSRGRIGTPGSGATPTLPVPPKEPTPGETGPVRTVVIPVDIRPIEQALDANDVPRALGLLEGVSNQADEGVRRVAKRIAERSMDDMAAAERTAGSLKAGDLASTQFESASEGKVRAERAFQRDEYTQAAKQALAATTGFRSAADEARRVADARKKPEAPTPPPVAATPPKLAASDSAGILNALTTLQKAYRDRDVDAIKRLIPALPQQQMNAWRSNFKNCREVEVSFASMRTLVAPDDASAATVQVKSTYFCQPAIRAPAREVPQDDVFNLRKVGETWVIERMGALDPR